MDKEVAIEERITKEIQEQMERTELLGETELLNDILILFGINNIKDLYQILIEMQDNESNEEYTNNLQKAIDRIKVISFNESILQTFYLLFSMYGENLNSEENKNYYQETLKETGYLEKTGWLTGKSFEEVKQNVINLIWSENEINGITAYVKSQIISLADLLFYNDNEDFYQYETELVRLCNTFGSVNVEESVENIKQLYNDNKCLNITPKGYEILEELALGIEEI